MVKKTRSRNIQNHKIGFKSGIKILIPNKLLTRLPVILALVNAGNNSHKLRPEIRQILYFLHQNIKITKKWQLLNQVIITIAVPITDNKFVIITKLKTFYFDLHIEIWNLF